MGFKTQVLGEIRPQSRVGEGHIHAHECLRVWVAWVLDDAVPEFELQEIADIVWRQNLRGIIPIIITYIIKFILLPLLLPFKGEFSLRLLSQQLVDGKFRGCLLVD